MRIALQWLTSWLALLALWLGFVGELSAVEVGAGAIAAAIAATAAAVARAHGLASVSLGRAWALRSLRVPFRTMSELGLILVALLRGRPHGRMKTARFSPRAGGGSSAASAAARASGVSPSNGGRPVSS